MKTKEQLSVFLGSIYEFLKQLVFNYFTDPFQGGTSFVDHMYYLCLVFVILSRLLITALWSPAGKKLTSPLLFVMLKCDFVIFPCGILGQVW